jgi:hypothetical protein
MYLLYIATCYSALVGRVLCLISSSAYLYVLLVLHVSLAGVAISDIVDPSVSEFTFYIGVSTLLIVFGLPVFLLCWTLVNSHRIGCARTFNRYGARYEGLRYQLQAEPQVIQSAKVIPISNSLLHEPDCQPTSKDATPPSNSFTITTTVRREPRAAYSTPMDYHK